MSSSSNTGNGSGNSVVVVEEAVSCVFDMVHHRAMFFCFCKHRLALCTEMLQE